jgi:hypothetical protein
MRGVTFGLSVSVSTPVSGLLYPAEPMPQFLGAEVLFRQGFPVD